MLHRLIRRAVNPCPLLLVMLSLMCLYAWAKDNEMQSRSTSESVPYRVLDDYMGTTMRIGVASNVDERHLRATLIKAADDHQNDGARDLLFSDYLWIEAYLTDGERRSIVPAGRIRRYVPPKNPSKETDWLNWLSELEGKKDRFTIMLDEANRALQGDQR